MEIIFDNRQDYYEIDINLIKDIEKCIKTALEIECIDISNIEVSVSFVSNEEIKDINKEFRNVNSVTDVLSFPVDFEFFEEGMPNLLGDIVISVERAIEQAKEFEHSISREILYLVCHSMFHLLGYDHMTDDEKVVMRAKEKLIMKKMEVFKNA